MSVRTDEELEIAMNPDLTLFVDRMKSHPDEFEQTKHTFIHKPSGIQVWTSNGVNSVSFYKCLSEDNSFHREFKDEEKRFFWKAFNDTQASARRILRGERRRVMHKYFSPKPPMIPTGLEVKVKRIKINLKRAWRILWS